MCAPHFSEREFRDSDRAPQHFTALLSDNPLKAEYYFTLESLLQKWHQLSGSPRFLNFTSRLLTQKLSCLILRHFFPMCNGLNINWLPQAHAFEVTVSCWQHWFRNYLDKKHSRLILRFREQGYTLLACGCGLGSLCTVCQSEVTSHLKFL